MSDVGGEIMKRTFALFLLLAASGCGGDDITNEVKDLQQSPSPQTRALAASMLGDKTYAPHRVLPFLQHAMATDPDPDVRVQAAHAIWKLDRSQEKAVVSSLVAALKGKEDNVRDSLARVEAAEILGKIGPSAMPAVPVLGKWLKKKDYAYERLLAAEAMSHIDPKTRGKTIPIMIATLRNDDPIIRMAAVKALGGLGKAADKAIPEITKLLNDEDVTVRQYAATALESIAKSGNTKQQKK